ncbi:MAG: hypothetical protein EOM26_08680 [Alphaproteobacteria bacterium]|nr:hypothetical protein [Alphaproteobacteria bacterium]
MGTADKKGGLDDYDLKSILTSISASDSNALGFLEIMADEIDPEIVAAQSAGGLPVYLQAVFHGAHETARYLLEQATVDCRELRSALPTFANQMTIPFSQSLRSWLPIDGANDVCWAVLSDNPDSVSRLFQTYRELGIEAAFNDDSARLNQIVTPSEPRYTPLDIAVMSLVSRQSLALLDSRVQQANMKAAVVSMAPALSDLFELLGVQPERVTIVGPGFGTENATNGPDPGMETKIRQLLDAGARGSSTSLFPSEIESVKHPFISRAGFKSMSLSGYVQRNAWAFSDSLHHTLTGKPKPGSGRELTM